MPHRAVERLFATVALVLVAAVASANTVYEVNTTGATQTGSKNNSGVYIGQSFNSGTNTLLTSASLEINRNGLSIADFTLNLYAATGSPGNYFKTGSSLADATFSNSILSDSLATSYEFTNLNWALSPNTVYMIGVASESTATVKWTLNQSATKDSSTGFITGYSGYNAQEGSNVDNGLHGATITAVPEPSTHLALGIAAAGMWLMARRRTSSKIRT
ncbi:MAG: PEP-CTERM sorting domain-containing protein [Planctomycetes bacterium]|nr:PEP-CTERM sorting domain-containing protein [Planctomycetota bacterium]